MKNFKLILFNLIFLGILFAGLEYFASVLLSREDNSIKNNSFDEIKKKAYGELGDQFYLRTEDCPFQKILTKNTDGSSVRFENPNWSCAGVYPSQGFSVKDNRRVTTNQPKDFKRKVHVFGGSTIFGYGTADNFTIPSSL